MTSTLRKRNSSGVMEDITSQQKNQASVTSGQVPPKHNVTYEFGGPIGGVSIMVLLPLVVYFLYYSASSQYKFKFWNISGLAGELPTSFDQVFSKEALLVVVIWFLFNVILERVLYHTKVKGVVLRSGERLTYRISGHLQFWVVLLLVIHGNPSFDPEGNLVGTTHFPLQWVYDNYIQLATGSIIFSTGLSFLLYALSFRKGVLLAEGGDTGSPVYDMFIGRELNPRISWLSELDLKHFCELRPGLIGWVVINIGCLMKQYSILGRVTPPMLMVNVFQGLYVFDALYYERAILTTMDITTDGFGFMLAFGDLAWVPFTYTLQARYLVENSPSLSVVSCVLICLLNFTGYYIFRSANSQKDAFRRNPRSSAMKHLETITTSSGRQLLISGWWGLARKINYTGDWMMGLAWCLTTGFDCIVPYFYCIYFFILLVHRSLRDDHACAGKYGAYWTAYKEKVPYLFIPYLI